MKESLSEKKIPRFLDGYFLISETELQDPNFHQTVVLLIQHNTSGAFGLVVNRTSPATLGTLVEDFSNLPAGNLPVYIGGPVDQMYLFVLHSGLPGGVQSEHATEPVEGVIFEPDFTIIADFLANKWPGLKSEERPHIHLYAGYSGWAPEQLEGELKLKSWVIYPAVPEIVFSGNPEEGWRDALRKKGGIYWVAAETGSKPSMN